MPNLPTIASSALTPKCDVHPSHGHAVLLFADPSDGPNGGKSVSLCWPCVVDFGLDDPSLPSKAICHPMGVAA